MIREEKRSKSNLESDSTEDEIGMLCMSNEGDSIDDDDEDEEICQPIKKARTRARREKKPKVMVEQLISIVVSVTLGVN